MPSRKLLLLALVLSIPITADAQRGGGGAPPVTTGAKVERGDRRGSYNVGLSDGSFPISISDKDVEGLSPVKVLLDRKKDLTLTEQQVKQLKDMETALRSENDTLFNQLDSLRKEMRSNKNAPNQQVEMLRVRSARTATFEVVKALGVKYEAAEPNALKVLTDEQQKPATELLEKHQAEAEKMLREKLGGGGRRPPG
jgi:hypothetical protein